MIQTFGDRLLLGLNKGSLRILSGDRKPSGERQNTFRPVTEHILSPEFCLYLRLFCGELFQKIGHTIFQEIYDKVEALRTSIIGIRDMVIVGI